MASRTKIASSAAFGLMLAGSAKAATSTYAIPASVPTNAAALDQSPVGISYEFFTFPSYHSNVSATTQCEQNFKDLTGIWPHIRIGGTTQDRATYDASSSAYVTYSVASSADAPLDLTYGPNFFTLANAYGGSVVIGLNRGRNNLANTITAAQAATGRMSNLHALELGNEPEYYKQQSQPIAAGTWDATVDAQSQANWQISVGTALGKTNVIQASNSLMNPPTWGAQQLISAHNSTALSYIKHFAHHNYPGGTVTSLMSHASVISNIAGFSSDIAAAKAIGREYVLGETNSATGGGASGVSPLFGAALWVADVSLRAATAGIKRLYFHHGTIGNCQYCWWGRYNVGAPYYGAYFATAATAGGSYIAPIDTGSSNYAVYAIYSSSNAPIKVVLYNSDYYSGSGTRGSQTFVLTGLASSTVSAKRLTAVSANSRQDQGQNPTFAGRSFTNGTCLAAGTEVTERTSVSGGTASFTVAASEALLVYL